jgi:hypothetical protein
MCNWRNADNREGAHGVAAVRLGRGKGNIPLTSFCLLKQKSGGKYDEYYHFRKIENNQNT